MLTERGLDVGGLSESVDETHLTVEQRARFHKVVYHLLSADLPVPVKESREREREVSVTQESLQISQVRKKIQRNKSVEGSLVLVQIPKLAEVRKVVPNCFKFITGDMSVTVCVEVLEDRL